MVNQNSSPACVPPFVLAALFTELIYHLLLSVRYYNIVQESLSGHGTSLVLLVYVQWLGSLAVSSDAAQVCLTKQNQPSTLRFSGRLASLQLPPCC